MPEEINKLGRTITAWRTQISNWHAARVTNAPTEAANNLIKRVRRTPAPPSDSPTSTTTASEPCSTPANPTGYCSKPSLRPKTRRAT